ncbi:MAG TPA: hypothetical protein VLC52_16895, partial [Anaerolineae bacterium]|nr:hypothetical protein [Anaerolineae bacterium]
EQAAGRRVALQTARPAVVVAPASVEGAGRVAPGGALPAEAQRMPGQGMAMGMAGPAINVEQLTDQVVQSIDRRILAERERMGRLY